MSTEESAVMAAGLVVSASENVTDGMTNSSVMNWSMVNGSMMYGSMMNGRVMNGLMMNGRVMNRRSVVSRYSHVGSWHSVARWVHGWSLHGVSHLRCLLVLRSVAWRSLTLRDSIALRCTWGVLLHDKIYFIYIIIIFKFEKFSS